MAVHAFPHSQHLVGGPGFEGLNLSVDTGEVRPLGGDLVLQLLDSLLRGCQPLNRARGKGDRLITMLLGEDDRNARDVLASPGPPAGTTVMAGFLRTRGARTAFDVDWPSSLPTSSLTFLDFLPPAAGGTRLHLCFDFVQGAQEWTTMGLPPAFFGGGGS